MCGLRAARRRRTAHMPRWHKLAGTTCFALQLADLRLAAADARVGHCRPCTACTTNTLSGPSLPRCLRCKGAAMRASFVVCVLLPARTITSQFEELVNLFVFRLRMCCVLPPCSHPSARHQANPGAGLPVLYLTDSICKNVGGVYIALFSELLADVVGRLLSEVCKNTLRQFYGGRLLADPTPRSSSLRHGVFLDPLGLHSGQ